MLKIVFHNRNNLMDYLYSLQNVAVQYSTMSCVSPTFEHYMFNVTCLPFFMNSTAGLSTFWMLGASSVVLDGGGPGQSKHGLFLPS